MRSNALPVSCPPRGLSRAQAAEYLGIGTTLFDTLVSDGRIHQPKRIEGRVVWDRLRLDEDFSSLPESAPTMTKNEWDE